MKIILKLLPGLCLLLLMTLSVLTTGYISSIFSQPIDGEKLSEVNTKFQDRLERIGSITGHFGVIENFLRLKVDSEVGFSVPANLKLNDNFYAPVTLKSGINAINCPVIEEPINIRGLQKWWSNFMEITIPNCINNNLNNLEDSSNKVGIELIDKLVTEGSVLIKLDHLSLFFVFVISFFFWSVLLIFPLKIYNVLRDFRA